MLERSLSEICTTSPKTRNPFFTVGLKLGRQTGRPIHGSWTPRRVSVITTSVIHYFTRLLVRLNGSDEIGVTDPLSKL